MCYDRVDLGMVLDFQDVGGVRNFLAPFKLEGSTSSSVGAHPAARETTIPTADPELPGQLHEAH